MWHQQPQIGPSSIDTSQPLARGLALAINPGTAPYQDSLNNRVGNKNGLFTAPGALGIGLRAVSNSSAGMQIAGSQMRTSDGAGTGEFTYLVIANPIASNTRELFVVSQNGATEFYFGANLFVGLSSGSGVVSAQTNGLGTTGRDAATAADGKTHVYIYTRSSSNGTLYLDGQNVSAGPVAANQMWSPSSSDVIGGYTAPGWGISNSVFLVLGWNRALSAAEAKEISANPWQLFVDEDDSEPSWISTVGGIVSYLYTAVGGIQTGGSATRLRGATRSTSGGTTISGTSTRAAGRAYTALGGIIFSGVAGRAASRIKVAVGGLNLAGAAVIQLTNSFQNKVVQAVGGILLSGTSAIRRELSKSSLGGITFGGSSGYFSGGQSLGQVWGALNDVIYQKLKLQGKAGSRNDMLNENVYWRALAGGNTILSLNDVKKKVLREMGYTGTLNQMEKKYWGDL